MNTNTHNDGRLDSTPCEPVHKDFGFELDLVVELERLAACEEERFLELEEAQILSVGRIDACLERLGQGAANRKLSVACQQVLQERSALIDVDYLARRSAEVLARESVLTPTVPWQDGFPSDQAWVHERVCEALSEVLLEDDESYSDGHVMPLDGEFHHQCLVHSYGVELDSTLAASVRFHRLPDETRRAFFALLVEKWTVERCVSLGLGPRFRLRVQVRSALKALLFLEDLWPSIQIPERNEEGHGYGEF